MDKTQVAEKDKFIQKFNEAFAKSDVKYLNEHVTDDILWSIMGEQVVHGKQAFTETLRQMAADEPFELTISNIITQGNTSAVNGTMKSQSDGSTYAFCDIYKFNELSGLKIMEMTSYALEVKE